MKQNYSGFLNRLQPTNPFLEKFRQYFSRNGLVGSLHLELRYVTCNGAEENQAHRCDPYDLRVQEQPLFLVYSSINIFTSMGLDP